MKKRNMYKIIIFVLLSIATFSDNIYIVPGNGEINQKNRENAVSENNSVEDDDGFIYLDRIIETEEEKKEEKKSKIERAINKLDEKVNPPLRFNIFLSYGNWYLIKTTSVQEARYENVAYNFKEEQNGYRIERNYYNKTSREWIKASERGWIEERKGKVYLGTEKKWFTSYANEVLFFDSGYKYMIIRYESDGMVRVFSRVPGKINLSGEDKEKFHKIIDSYPGLTDIVFDSEIDNIRADREAEKAEIERKAKIMEEQLKRDPKSVFEINEFKK